MWLSEKLLSILRVSSDITTAQQADLAVLRAENTLLRQQLTTAEANFKWITTRVNALEIERAALFERAYGVKIAVPEIIQSTPRTPLSMDPATMFGGDLFDDVGDAAAKKHGLEIQLPQIGFPSAVG